MSPSLHRSSLWIWLLLRACVVAALAGVAIWAVFFSKSDWSGVGVGVWLVVAAGVAWWGRVLDARTSARRRDR
ncbi:MAG: hypothetical protein EOO27_04865 [Comamonadaceae bacterium]|nr:MAG: hypothetical protein EOO27_04865 [Comamonadaceae bacterium]